MSLGLRQLRARGSGWRTLATTGLNTSLSSRSRVATTNFRPQSLGCRTRTLDAAIDPLRTLTLPQSGNSNRAKPTFGYWKPTLFEGRESSVDDGSTRHSGERRDVNGLVHDRLHLN